MSSSGSRSSMVFSSGSSSMMMSSSFSRSMSSSMTLLTSKLMYGEEREKR